MLKIHWFLPTGGDARDVLPTAPNAHPRAPGPAVPRAGRPGVRPTRLRRHAHAVRHRMRGRLARHRLADPAHPPDQVPGRVPPGPAHTDAGRADGLDVPAPLRRPSPREHRDGGRAGRARSLRRPRRQGHPLRADGRVPRDRPGCVERRPVHLQGPLLRGGRTPPPVSPRIPIPEIYFGGASPAAEQVAARIRSTSISPGANPRRWSRIASSACGGSRRRPVARCASGSGST